MKQILETIKHNVPYLDRNGQKFIIFTQDSFEYLLEKIDESIEKDKDDEIDNYISLN